MSLPRDFLTQLEQYSELSNREKAVFLEIFGNGKSRLLVNCLNSDCNISDKIRQKIEHNLLLPISKI
ncbi:NACHT C-terminal helical domain 2-containing protein [Nostoc sp. KVJ3]|uniref:NACHT C-terminal helical domain 2-containing protein n=1 Tax=Nostoc sp. KVJ3 TaxID=457945 RepID=UPI0039E07A3D